MGGRQAGRWPSSENNGRGLGSDVRAARGSFSGRRVEAARATAPWKRKRGRPWGDWGGLGADSCACSGSLSCPEVVSTPQPPSALFPPPHSSGPFGRTPGLSRKTDSLGEKLCVGCALGSRPCVPSHGLCVPPSRLHLLSGVGTRTQLCEEGPSHGRSSTRPAAGRLHAGPALPCPASQQFPGPSPTRAA